jgi:hypothetical protein
VARTCDGGADSRLSSRSGRPVRDIMGYAAAGINANPLLFSLTGGTFPMLRGT